MVALNFTSPVYVSSGEIGDEIKIRVKNPMVF